MSKRGIVNVRMVITEEKILANIVKAQGLINPNNKKQIIQLEDDSYFKDLVESIKAYLIEYPKKKNFPASVYKAAYGLVEYATNQFEENTKQIEELIRQREENIRKASLLKNVLEIVKNKEPDWKKTLQEVSNDLPEDIIDTLGVVGRAKSQKSQNFNDAQKIVNARIANLESNLHIEIDMERIEDKSKALSYIGIEIADALKLIPTPQEETTAMKYATEEKVKVKENVKTAVTNKIENTNTITTPEANSYYGETRVEVKPSLWQRFKNTKVIRAIRYAFKIKVVLQLPEGLPQGNESQNNF